MRRLFPIRRRFAGTRFRTLDESALASAPSYGRSNDRRLRDSAEAGKQRRGDDRNDDRSQKE
jgi:hypothetical protein